MCAVCVYKSCLRSLKLCECAVCTYVCERVGKKNEDNEKANTNEKEKVERMNGKMGTGKWMLIDEILCISHTHTLILTQIDIYAHFICVAYSIVYLLCSCNLWQTKNNFRWFTFHSTLHRTYTCFGCFSRRFRSSSFRATQAGGMGDGGRAFSRLVYFHFE